MRQCPARLGAFLDEAIRPANFAVARDRDLDRVEQVTIEQGPKRFVLRPQAPGCAGAVFKAVGVALPPLIQQIPTGPPPPAKAPPSPPHRGRPRCGATSP